jgi:hypothetical protein
MTCHRGLVLFLATLAVTVPAAWRSTTALLPVDGAPVRPPIATLAVDDVTVTASMDKAVVEDGEEVAVQLVAMSSTRQQVKVEIALEQRSGEPRGRSMAPSVQIERQEVTLVAAKGGGKPRTITVKPRAARSPGMLTAFTVRLSTQGKAAQPAYAALTGSVSQSPGYEIHILDVAGPDPDGRCVATVQVANVSDRALENVRVQLSSAITFQPVEGNGTIAALGAGESVVLRYAGVLDGHPEQIPVNAYAMTSVGRASESKLYREEGTTVAAAPAGAEVSFAQPPPEIDVW